MQYSRTLTSRTEWFFVKSSAILLAITGMAKLISVMGHTLALSSSEPITGFSYRTVFGVAGLVEVMLALYTLGSERPKNALVALAMISAIFVIYRVGLKCIGWDGPCSCLGS